ncbi:MAG: hypothetical protein ACRCZJ_07400 [Erysipelotrichaceae bacterium]
MSKTNRYIQIGDAIKAGLSPSQIEPTLSFEELELFEMLLTPSKICEGAFDFCRDIEND